MNKHYFGLWASCAAAIALGFMTGRAIEITPMPLWRAIAVSVILTITIVLVVEGWLISIQKIRVGEQKHAKSPLDQPSQQKLAFW